jgi:hypothetical protein
LPNQIPRRREDLTADWFNLAVVGSHPEIPRVSGLHIDDSLRQGMMSQTFRILLRYVESSDSAPASVVVKLSAAEPEMRKRPASRLNALKEVRFYQELGARIDVPTPTCLFADVDFESGYHVLVLEDLAPATQRQPESGCLRAEAERAVVLLARLHAHWWENPELALLEWLPEAEPVDPVEALERHRRWWPQFLETAAQWLPEEMIIFGQRYGEAFPRLINELLFGSPRTLRHGDYSLTNMLFREEKDRRDEGLTIIDWQMVSRGKGPWDLAWFLGQSLTIEQRRAWERDLLALYHDGLLHGGVAGYRHDDCLADYRRAITQRFGTLISSIVALPFSIGQKAEILRIQLPRNVAAIQDHGGIALLG